MIVAIIPGFSRSAQVFADWPERLRPHEVRIYDLPGHGGERPLAEPSLPAMVEQFLGRIPPEALVVGESLGGLIALGMAGAGRAVVSIDPPLTMSKQWLLELTLTDMIERNPHARWLPDFIARIFGIVPGQPIEPIEYWPLLDVLPRPVDVLYAGIPLWPVRDIALTPDNCPSVLDEEDVERLAVHPMVRVHGLEGPHGLLTTRPLTVRQCLWEVLSGLDPAS